MFLVIDNYDSFTYNLVQYLGELSVEHEITKELIVKRNDEISLEEIIKLNPDGILLSPGPGNPDQSGICLPILKKLSKTIPILGVCLGHQALAQAFGGKVIVGKELESTIRLWYLVATNGVSISLNNPFGYEIFWMSYHA